MSSLFIVWGTGTNSLALHLDYVGVEEALLHRTWLKSQSENSHVPGFIIIIENPGKGNLADAGGPFP